MGPCISYLGHISFPILLPNVLCVFRTIKEQGLSHFLMLRRRALQNLQTTIMFLSPVIQVRSFFLFVILLCYINDSFFFSAGLLYYYYNQVILCSSMELYYINRNGTRAHELDLHTPFIWLIRLLMPGTITRTGFNRPKRCRFQRYSHRILDNL